MGQTKFGTCKDGAWKPAGCERNDSMKNKDGKLTSIVGKDAVVGGNFSTPGSARIDGVVEGSARVAGSLIVGSTGRIEGDVEADSIIIGGEINGDVTVQGKAELTATARVIGDIRTSLIVIDEKAVFQGKCDMNIATGKTKNAPQNRLRQAKNPPRQLCRKLFWKYPKKSGQKKQPLHPGMWMQPKRRTEQTIWHRKKAAAFDATASFNSFRSLAETGEFTPASSVRIPFHNRRFRSLGNGLHG